MGNIESQMTREQQSLFTLFYLWFAYLLFRDRENLLIDFLPLGIDFRNVNYSNKSVARF